MFIFQFQKSVSESQNSSSQDKQNTAYDIIFHNLGKTGLVEGAIDVATKKFGLIGKDAAAYAKEANASASIIIDRIFKVYDVSPESTISDKTMNKIIKAFKSEFAHAMGLNEGLAKSVQNGKITDMFSFISCAITSSTAAYKDCQDPKKVDAILKSYGLSDSSLCNFLEQLPNSFAVNIPSGAQEAAAYNAGHRLQTGRMIDFMKETDDFTKDASEKEKKKRA